MQMVCKCFMTGGAPLVAHRLRGSQACAYQAFVLDPAAGKLQQCAAGLRPGHATSHVLQLCHRAETGASLCKYWRCRAPAMTDAGRRTRQEPELCIEACDEACQQGFSGRILQPPSPSIQLVGHARRRMRQNGKPKRDEYMRQIIDTKGVLNRLAINADETERDIIEEFEENQWESREAIKFAGMQ